jgi:hypothetical protein
MRQPDRLRHARWFWCPVEAVRKRYPCGWPNSTDDGAPSLRSLIVRRGTTRTASWAFRLVRFSILSRVMSEPHGRDAVKRESNGLGQRPFLYLQAHRTYRESAVMASPDAAMACATVRPDRIRRFLCWILPTFCSNRSVDFCSVILWVSKSFSR